MPTDNRRVATYLPKEIDDRLKAFIAERNLKGDSPALIAILSEFFEVSQEVTHQSSSLITSLQDRVEALEEKLAHIKSELYSELRAELLEHHDSFIEQTKGEVKDELLSELRSKLPMNTKVPGQLELIPDVQISQEKGSEISKLSGELKSELSDEWMTTKECWEYLGKPGAYDTFRRLTPEKLNQLYGVDADTEKKKQDKYNSRWLRLPKSGTPEFPTSKTENAVPLDQVNPMPEGSERSEEG